MRILLALIAGPAAFHFSDLASASLLRSVMLPLLATAAALYLLIRMVKALSRGSGGDGYGGDTGWSFGSSCDSDSGSCGGGGDGGGGD